MATSDVGKYIRHRVWEKRREASALRHIAWLMMGVSAIILLTLLRVVLMFNQQPVDLPALLWSMLPLHVVLLTLFLLALRKIKASEMDSAFYYCQSCVALSTALTAILLTGWSSWFTEMVYLQRTAHAAWMVMMIFLGLNYLVGTWHLFKVAKGVRAHSIHSMSLDTFHKSQAFWLILFMLTSIIFLFLALE